MKVPTSSKSVARARLVAVASGLFYRKGIPNVGINEIIETSAVARMTLYNHFSSKDELVLAVMEQRREERQKGIVAAMARPRGARAKILAAFDYLAKLTRESDFRGCAFVNAAVERANSSDPVHRLVAGHKTWIAAQFEAIARGGPWPRPDLLAQQLLVLWDGAAVGAYLQGNANPVVAARSAAKALLPPAPKR